MRTPVFNAPAPVELPADVRWLNLTASALFVVGAALALALLVTWGMRQPAFSFRTIVVEGEVEHNSPATIRASAFPRLDGNFFTLNLAEGRRAFETVPWVREATVRRVWPNRLVVRLEEHRAAAFWEGEDKVERIVNTFGELFEADADDVDASLPTLKGPHDTSGQMLAAYRRLAPVFQPIDLRVERLVQSNRGSWRAEFYGGAEVEIGRGSEDELVERATRFVNTVPQIVERYQRPIVYADLRHNEGYALRLKGVTTTLAPIRATK